MALPTLDYFICVFLQGPPWVLHTFLWHPLADTCETVILWHWKQIAELITELINWDRKSDTKIWGRGNWGKVGGLGSCLDCDSEHFAGPQLLELGDSESLECGLMSFQGLWFWVSRTESRFHWAGKVSAKLCHVASLSLLLPSPSVASIFSLYLCGHPWGLPASLLGGSLFSQGPSALSWFTHSWESGNFKSFLGQILEQCQKQKKVLWWFLVYRERHQAEKRFQGLSMIYEKYI